MWILAFSIYAACKWVTWRRWQPHIAHPGWRSMAYLLAWPGMDAHSFLDTSSRATSPPLGAWLRSIFLTALGATLLWAGARTISESRTLLRGWTGMLGAILMLHFGSFKLAALLWQTVGVKATPIVATPLRSASLSDFWGRRWNLGFHQLAFDFVFIPIRKKLGSGLAAFLVFLVSGVIHDLVISVPARGGFGLPTLYFAIQGMGVAIERSRIGKLLGLRQGIRGWLFMAVVTASPVFWLFHPAFVLRVIIPFMKAVHAL